jgi:hypothetical protein
MQSPTILPKFPDAKIHTDIGQVRPRVNNPT